MARYSVFAIICMNLLVNDTFLNITLSLRKKQNKAIKKKNIYI